MHCRKHTVPNSYPLLDTGPLTRYRQRRIKEKLDNSRGQLPPNFNLLASKARDGAGPSQQLQQQQQQQQYEEPVQQAPAPASGDWRAALKLKRQQEEEARLRAERVS